MKITIINNQTDLKINKKKIEKITKLILKEENVTTNEVIFNFVDSRSIKKLHLQYFNDPTITDCISFPIDSTQKGVDWHILGEAFICCKEAINYSKKHKIDPYEELSLYIIHCILHLIGYDDINKKDKSIMRRKENFYLSLLKGKKII